MKVPANERHELFTTTFNKEDEMYKEVKVSLTHRDEEGNIHKERLTWLARTLPSDKGMHRSRRRESQVLPISAARRPGDAMRYAASPCRPTKRLLVLKRVR